MKVAVVDVDTRLLSPIKLSVKTIHLLERETNQNPFMGAKDLQECLADTGLIHQSNLHHYSHKYGLLGVIRSKP